MTGVYRLIAIVLSVLLCSVVAACSSVAVPQIPGGLDAAKLDADPCAAFTVDQLNSLGFVGEGKNVDDAYGGCDVSFGPNVSVYTRKLAKMSLATLYDLHSRSAGGNLGNHWEELRIAGYPAVIVNIRVDSLICDLNLGVADNVLIDISATVGGQESGSWRNDPCGATKKVAELVVTNLRR